MPGGANPSRRWSRKSREELRRACRATRRTYECRHEKRTVVSSSSSE